MASSSAAEVFSSPEAKVVGATLLGGVVGGGMVMGAQTGAAAAREQDARYEDAIDQAKNHTVETVQSGTESTTGATNQVSQTEFAPRSPEEQRLLDASISQYGQQAGLVDQYEAGITGRAGTQTAARDTLGGIMSGDAFALTGDEQSRINALRGADISASSNAVNALLTERLGEVSADAARRGVRGQAFSQLQGDAIGEAAKSLERSTFEANRTAAQNALAMPGQRVGIQAQTAGGFADFQDAAMQTAIKNRADLQDPVAMQALLDERLKGGKTSTSGTTSQTSATSGNQGVTGAGVTDIMAAQAGTPGEKAAGTAGAMGALGTMANIAGTVVKAGA
jgi:hypothetical protein